jgi:hypothetical protein
MNLFVMYSSKSIESAKALAQSLRETIKDKDSSVYCGTVNSKYLKIKNFSKVINVGNSIHYPFKKDVIIINPPKSVQVSANKKLARLRFKAKGIPAPMLWDRAKEIPDKEFPVVGRTTFHMKARGFWYCKNKEEAIAAEHNGATHFLKFINNTREFRAHVFSTCLEPKGINDFIIGKLSEKKASETTKSSIIKNHDTGYKFLAPSEKDPYVLQQIRHIAKLTLFKFGLHFGGVDIIYSNILQKPYVLEINSTPCMTDEHSSTLEIYTEKLLYLVGV